VERPTVPEKDGYCPISDKGHAYHNSNPINSSHSLDQDSFHFVRFCRRCRTCIKKIPLHRDDLTLTRIPENTCILSKALLHKGSKIGRRAGGRGGLVLVDSSGGRFDLGFYPLSKSRVLGETDCGKDRVTVRGQMIRVMTYCLPCSMWNA
jgi:hypothetical protein